MTIQKLILALRKTMKQKADIEVIISQDYIKIRIPFDALKKQKFQG